MKLINILNQFFTIKGENGVKFCVSADCDRQNNVTRIEYITTNSNTKLPVDWQSIKKRHFTTTLSKILPIGQNVSGLGMAYMPASTAVEVLNTVIPDSMGEEMQKALDGLKKALKNDVSGFVAERLQFSRKNLSERLAAEQVDAIALSIYNIEIRKQGFIIGDQTGVGKGRIAASMIRYAIVKGYKPIFLTESPNLFSDMYRDLKAIGCDHYRGFIVNAKTDLTAVRDEDKTIIYNAPASPIQSKIIKDIANDARIKLSGDYDFVMATYSQFRDAKLTDKKLFLSNFANENILIMDEAHNASGSGKKMKGKDGDIVSGSNTSAFFMDVVRKSKGVVFLTATFAKRADNMPIYCVKTCIGEVAISNEKLIEAINKGGVAMQEVLSSNVVKEGQMVRRERSKDQVITNYITLDKTGKQKFGVDDKEKIHREQLDTITSLIRDIIDFQDVYAKPIFDMLNKIYAAEMLNVEQRKGTDKLGVHNQDFASKTFNVIRQLLFSIKAEDVAKRAVKNLKTGKKVVIAFSSTMESMLNQLNEKYENSIEDENDEYFLDETLGYLGVTDGDVINADYSVSLLRGLESVLRYTVKDDTGTGVSYKSITVDELPETGAKQYKFLTQKIKKTTSGISISPIDIMLKTIRDAGFSVTEVTGRKYELNFHKNDISKATVNTRKKVNTAEAYQDFQNNRTDCLFINVKGATGASAHAIPTKNVPPDQVKQRLMIIAQPELDISKEVQKRGRIDRTGQIYPPIYEYISSAIPAEKRLMMMLQKKLKSLDANTTANQKTSKNVIDYDDFLNKYGSETVIDFLLENDDFNLKINDPLNLKDDSKDVYSKADENAINKVTQSVAIVPTKDQEYFYDTILEMYKNKVDYKIQSDEYDLEMETMNLEAETLEKTILLAGKGTGKSIFSQPTYQEVCMVNVLKKPFTAKEMNERLSEAKKLDQNAIKEEYMRYMQDKYEIEKQQINNRWDEVKNNVTNEKGYKKTEDENQYVQQRYNEIEESKRLDVEHKLQVLRNQAVSIKLLMEYFTAGKICNFAYGASQDMTIPAVCLGVSINEKSKNKFSPSNISFAFAVADSMKYAKLNCATDQRTSLEQIKSHWAGNFYDLIANWEQYTKKRSANREKRVIITGNVLQAYSDDKIQKGKFISFTRKNGDTDKGIIIRHDIGEKMIGENTRRIESITVPISRAKEIIMKNMKNGERCLCNGFFISHNYNEYVITTNGTKRQEHEWLILNDNILSNANDGNFYSNRTGWYAYFSKENMPAVIDLLSELGVNAKFEGDNASLLQKEIQSEKFTDTTNWKKIDWDENNIPKHTKTAKKISSDEERLRLLELEMEMEIAIMEMELELDGQKSVAGIDYMFESPLLIPDSYFTNPSDRVILTTLSDKVLKLIGIEPKPIEIKKTIFEKNLRNHSYLTIEESKKILAVSLYHPDMIINDKPNSHPNYWVSVRINKKNAIVTIDVDKNKKNIEVVGWRWADDKSINQIKKRAVREGGQILITN